MKPPSDILDAPLKRMVERGKRTIETVLTRAGSRRADALQTTTNEVTYLLETTRLAIEELPTQQGETEKELHAARLRGLARMAELRKAAEPMLETGEVCALLGISRETVRKKIERRQLLALPKGGDRVFPAFQFRDGDVVAGLADVLLAVRTDSIYVILSFLLSRNPEFKGKTAIEMLLRGKIEPVLSEAKTFLDHGD